MLPSGPDGIGPRSRPSPALLEVARRGRRLRSPVLHANLICGVCRDGVGMMSGPGKTALASIVAIVLVGYSILSAGEAPSTALSILQYVLLAMAVIGLVGSLVKMGR